MLPKTQENKTEVVRNLENSVNILFVHSSNFLAGWRYEQNVLRNYGKKI